MNRKSYKFIYVLVAALMFCSQKNYAQKTTPIAMDAIENYFFRLDFAKEAYKLSDVENHFFTTFPHDDPTEGNIVYDRKKWENKDMLELREQDGLYLYIKTRKDSSHFDSNRLTSKPFYNLNEENQRLLFVFKGELPSEKGAWPAWWLNGSYEDEWTYQNTGAVETDAGLDKYSGVGRFYNTPSAVNCTDWPAAGEVDIIETINGDNIVRNTIHTCPQMCDSEWNSNGVIINCANAKSDGDPNAGCSGKPYKVASVAGTFACIWEKNTLQFYYWTPDEEVRKSGGPLSENPQPNQWRDYLKNEVRLMETDAECDVKKHNDWQCKNCANSSTCSLVNMKIIFNITLCGKWAGAKFDKTKQSMQNCQSYIANEGREKINNLFIKIEYLSVNKI